MKIEMLSLADLSENQTDVVVPADLPPEELENMQDEAAQQEEHQAALDAQTEDQVTGQSLIDEVVALEALFEKISTTSAYTIHHAMEAYEMTHDSTIMDTYRSGASSPVKLSVAMEGIMSKAWEAVKRFWAHLVAMWKKFIQYISRFVNGSSLDDLSVDQKLVTTLEAMLNEGRQRLQHNQQNGLLLRSNPEEGSMLKKAWHQSGSGKAPEVLAKVREMLPKTDQFIKLAEKYVRDLENWLRESERHPDAQTVMPAGPDSTMSDYVETCEAMRKAIPSIWLRGVDEHIQSVKFNDIMVGVKSSVIQAEYGLVRSLERSAHTILDFTEKRQKDVEKEVAKEDGSVNRSKIYRALGQELAVLKDVIGDVFMLFYYVKQAQRKMISVGKYWLWCVELAYKDMGEKDAHYSEEDKAHFKTEYEFFKDLQYKYDKLIDKKGMLSTIV